MYVLARHCGAQLGAEQLRGAGDLSTAIVGTAAAASASANHILVKDEAKCLELKAAIEASGDVMAKFTELAKEHS